MHFNGGIWVDKFEVFAFTVFALPRMTGREEEGEAEVAEGSKMSITLRVRAGGGTRLSTPFLLVGIAGRRGEEGPGMEEG